MLQSRHPESGAYAVTQTIRDMLAQRASLGFVGREKEMVILDRLLKRDGPVVMHIHGLAGIGKTTLLRAFAARAQSDEVTVINLECRSIEPTERGFLQGLDMALGVEQAESDIERTAERLSATPGIVLLTLDTFELLRLLDSWLRQEFIPRLGSNVRILLCGRYAPTTAWQTSPEWLGLFQSVFLEPFNDGEALRLLSLSGVSETTARSISRFARGHPLALRLAASAVNERPEMDFERLAVRRIIDQLTSLYLNEVKDPITRLGLEAAAVVRRITRSLLKAMLPDIAPQDVWDRLRDLPFAEINGEGLVVHDAVRDAISSALKSTDPTRYREFKRSAWRQLRIEARTAGRNEIWGYSADMLYLLDNPLFREAYFPSGLQEYSVEPAEPTDGEAISEIIHRYDGPESAKCLMTWWRRYPQSFKVARNPRGEVAGFYLLIELPHDDPELLAADPMTKLLSEYVRENPVPGNQKTMFTRRWLDRETGEGPSPVQGAIFMDIKGVYMGMRPDIRQVFVTLRELKIYASPFEIVGLHRMDAPSVVFDGQEYIPLIGDMGPLSVDGWMARLVAAELGIEEGGILDVDARELVLDNQRVGLTRLEFEVMHYLY
ncbi:MAG: ATP-binding protein [SAR202 cluster bacterium]|nr:ATP-binding protein [SAR202 cluster bacterium]